MASDNSSPDPTPSNAKAVLVAVLQLTAILGVWAGAVYWRPTRHLAVGLLVVFCALGAATAVGTIVRRRIGDGRAQTAFETIVGVGMMVVLASSAVALVVAVGKHAGIATTAACAFFLIAFLVFAFEAGGRSTTKSRVRLTFLVLATVGLAIVGLNQPTQVGSPVENDRYCIGPPSESC